MKFHPVSQEIAESDGLAEEYAVARQIGTVRVGRSVLFFRAGLKTYYIPYDAVHRCFRRVYQVPMKMCCGRGEVDYEHLIISDGEKEVADIPLPGTKAAQELIRLLKEKMPDADFRAPRETGEAAGQEHNCKNEAEGEPV